MTIHKHEICLESDQHFDGRLPTHHFGFLMADLPVAIRGAVSMALRNRSMLQASNPLGFARQVTFVSLAMGERCHTSAI